MCNPESCMFYSGGGCNWRVTNRLESDVHKGLQSDSKNNKPWERRPDLEVIINHLDRQSVIIPSKAIKAPRGIFDSCGVKPGEDASGCDKYQPKSPEFLGYPTLT